MTINQPYLQETTIVPKPSDDEDTFIQYFNRLYEDIARAVNQRDFVYFPFAISSIAQNIPNIETFGSYIICVSGQSSGLPSQTVSLVKSDSSISGMVDILGTQVGTGVWAGFNIVVSSTATNFQIRHDRPNAIGNFNIRIIGTQ